jgi:diamine N-acetyltransferase
MPELDCGSLREDEAEALAALARRIWYGHYPALIGGTQIEYMLARRYHPPYIRQTLARGDRWDVARAAGALVGFAHSYPLEGGAVKLDKLYVDPDWQRHGVGALLVERVVKRARRQGRSHLLLRVNRGNAQAIAAYVKYGFVIAGQVVEDIGGGFVMDDYVMIKPL